LEKVEATAMNLLNQKPYYTRIALLGIAMYLCIEVVILIINLIFTPSWWLYSVVVGGIFGAIGAAIYFARPWGYIVGILGGLVAILFATDGIGDSLSSPDSFFDFAYRPVIGLAAAVFILGGSVAGLVQHVRRRTSASGAPNVTVAVKAVLGLVVILSLLSAVLTIAGVDRVSAADKKGATTITANGLTFDTATLTAAADGTTKIVVRNDDTIVHTFTVGALGIDVKVGPRSENLIVLTSPKPGTYEYYCRITGHWETMHGTLTAR
jgi:uncharacterized cupredoxin-like copper-binding protein